MNMIRAGHKAKSCRNPTRANARAGDFDDDFRGCFVIAASKQPFRCKVLFDQGLHFAHIHIFGKMPLAPRFICHGHTHNRRLRQ